MATARASQTATLLRDGRVLIAGGDAQPGGGGLTSLASSELYDPRTGSFSPTGSMAHGRRYHTATLLPDGRVLLAGGVVYDQKRSIAANVAASTSAELYDPATGKFGRTGSMVVGSNLGTATLLTDGTVFIAAGEVSGLPPFPQLYDPASGKFSPTGSMMPTPRPDHTATLLSDGRVLIAGGYGFGSLASAVLYQP